MGYTITDHLGSIWALAYEDGTFIEKYAYDPWGRRVNPDDWSLVDNRNQFITDRGFTLHEHYDQMQIINMVARLMDPLAGVFISVDPLADKYPGWGAYVYCMNNPLEYWDPDGEDWYENEEGEIVWTDFKNQEELDASETKGTYLGEAFVDFKGDDNESLGKDGTLTGEGANPAEVTIYGINGEEDIKTYNGLTMTSDPNEFVPIAEGDYKAKYQDMSKSSYGSKGGSLSYRLSTLDGGLDLPTKDNAPNKHNDNKPEKTAIFFHRTNNDGNAKYSSEGCPVIDGRSWGSVEKQLEKSQQIYFRVTR